MQKAASREENSHVYIHLSVIVNIVV